MTFLVLPVADMSKIIETFQADLPTRVFRATNAFNEAVYLAANEPSLGMYRLQEHIQTNVPKVVQQKQTLQRVRALHCMLPRTRLTVCVCVRERERERERDGHSTPKSL